MGIPKDKRRGHPEHRRKVCRESSHRHRFYERADCYQPEPRSLPPLQFEYSQVPTPEQLAAQPILEVAGASLENLPYGLDGAQYQWVDLDGEGMSGVLTEQADGWFYKRNLSPTNTVGPQRAKRIEPRFAPVELIASRPAMGLSSGHAQFMDLAGDGQVDLVLMDGPLRGFYERTEDAAGWESFRPFRA